MILKFHVLNHTILQPKSYRMLKCEALLAHNFEISLITHQALRDVVTALMF